MTTRTAITLAALLTGSVITGCGDSETITLAPDSDGKTVTGSFALVPEPPEGFDGVKGTAKLIRSDSGTEASIELSGLKPDVKYASHVHAGTCDQPDPGGPHFKFDVDGADTPPNEIHLPFTSDADGNGTAMASNDQTVPSDEGKSIVVHMAAADGEQQAAGGHGSHSGDEDKAAAKDEAGHSGRSGGDSKDGHGHSHAPKIACAPLGSSADQQSTSQPADAGPQALEVAAKNLKPVGGIKSLEVDKGERVRFTVTSDKPDEVHAHGYDISKDVAPGKPARFNFEAKIEGIFEVELEGAGEQIVKLTVNPG